MALKKTKLVSIVNVTGVGTVGIYTARAGIYIHPNTEASQRVAAAKSDAFRILRVDLAPNETTFFETNYPIVLAPYNAIAVDVIEPDAGGSGIGSMINVVVNGDTES